MPCVRPCPIKLGGHYVQTCPGTDWCKFGQQDAMALAAALEDKFGRLATPAKIKLEISDCTFVVRNPRMSNVWEEIRRV